MMLSLLTSLTLAVATPKTVAFNVSVVGGGYPVTATITLTEPAPVGGLVVDLASSDPAATPPATMTILAGALKGTAKIQTVPVLVDTYATITATANGGSAARTFRIATPIVTGVTVTPTSVVGGSGAVGRVNLCCAAPAGMTVALSATAPAAVPASITVPTGQTFATFPITTGSTPSTVGAVISATRGRTASSTLTVTPPSAVGLAFFPDRIQGGATSEGVVTLNGPAPVGGTSVTLSSEDPGVVSVPAFTLVPENAVTTAFVATTYPTSVGERTMIYADAASAYLHTRGIYPVDIVIPETIAANSTVTATLVVSAPALPGGQIVQVFSENPGTVSPTMAISVNVLIPEGQTTATFEVVTGDVSEPATGDLVAIGGSEAYREAITVTP